MGFVGKKVAGGEEVDGTGPGGGGGAAKRGGRVKGRAGKPGPSAQAQGAAPVHSGRSPYQAFSPSVPGTGPAPSTSGPGHGGSEPTVRVDLVHDLLTKQAKCQNGGMTTENKDAFDMFVD